MKKRHKTVLTLQWHWCCGNFIFPRKSSSRVRSYTRMEILFSLNFPNNVGSFTRKFKVWKVFLYTFPKKNWINYDLRMFEKLFFKPFCHNFSIFSEFFEKCIFGCLTNIFYFWTIIYTDTWSSWIGSWKSKNLDIYMYDTGINVGYSNTYFIHVSNWKID